MIKTTQQLKDKINNLSGGNPNKAQKLFRNYMMERFLERVSLSKYKNNFILKGGMLVASIVGLDMRATMDIDTTVESLPLNKDKAMEIIKEIADYPLDDNVKFEVNYAEEIMEEHEYSGIITSHYLLSLRMMTWLCLKSMLIASLNTLR
ncbi:MAG: nucleotidyl transferase AbiEii/AbiGii toxin family protein [Candidatus Gastranaerophilaceae bacterium]